MKNSLISSAGLIFKREKGKVLWFVVRKDIDIEEWGLPKTTSRKGESSVRAIIRYVVDFGGLNTQVLEEVDRMGGTTNVNGRITTTKTLYYLMVEKGGGEIKFGEYKWLELAKAVKKIRAKKEIKIIREAANMLKNLEKEKGKDYWVVEE